MIKPGTLYCNCCFFVTQVHDFVVVSPSAIYSGKVVKTKGNEGEYTFAFDETLNVIFRIYLKCMFSQIKTLELSNGIHQDLTMQCNFVTLPFKWLTFLSSRFWPFAWSKLIKQNGSRNSTNLPPLRSKGSSINGDVSTITMYKTATSS